MIELVLLYLSVNLEYLRASIPVAKVISKSSSLAHNWCWLHGKTFKNLIALVIVWSVFDVGLAKAAPVE